MTMTLDVLEGEIGAMLHSFMVDKKKLYLVPGVSVQFVVPQFGLIISGINRADYKMVLDAVNRDYADWRQVYITTFDKMEEVKYEVLWELMRSGYMFWLQQEHPRPFNRLIVEGFGDRIIKKRLELYGTKPKYNFLRELDTWAKDMAKTYVLSMYPGFFNHMVDA